MATRIASIVPAALLALSAVGCSWSRFDDVSDNTPVVLLKKPDSMKAGFGVSVTAISKKDDETTRVLVGGGIGQNAAADFDLGFGFKPVTDALDAGFCKPDEAPCYLGARPAGLTRAEVGGKEPSDNCFVVGAGLAAGFDDYGLFGRCGDGTEYTLPVPASVAKRTIKDELIDQAEAATATIRLSADRDEAPALVGGVEEQRLAWFYKPLSADPIELLATTKPDEGFGASEAVLRLGDSRLIVVGAPASSHVWLFSGDDGKPVGCLGGPDGFGTALASGDVDGDGRDDLVVSDTASVTVFSGASLSGLPANDAIDCSLSALGEGSVIASFGCGSRDSVTGCPGEFGTALDVGDLDGDGDGEVIVGAPGMTVRGDSNAGAILVYDAEGDAPETLTDVLYLASEQGNDRLGASLATAPLEHRDVVVGGVPGSGRTAIFYCSALAPDDDDNGGGRCE
jgi:hypothetical protein